MNPFTHVHSFETPSFYMCNVAMGHKFLRSEHKHIMLTRSSLCCYS